MSYNDALSGPGARVARLPALTAGGSGLMSPVTAVLLFFSAIAVLALATVLVRFNLKRLHIARCAAGSTPDQLERIYSLIEQTGTETSNGCVLGRINKTTNDLSCVVPLPADLSNFPWGGRTVATQADRTVRFYFVDGHVLEPCLLGHVYRAVRVPRSQQKNSTKARHTFSPERYLRNNGRLLAVLSEVCPRYPGGLLACLLCAGRSSFEFEPIDQARIGASPAWVQDPEYQLCEICKKRMALIVQLPGTLISSKGFDRGTLYFFGCVAHPDETKSLAQFT